MNRRTAALLFLGSLGTVSTLAQDWPQWRGPNRDAHAADFKAPKSWPKTLVRKWQVTVGDGVATPAVVGDKVFVFSRQDENEITRCLALADGKELWQDRYESLGATGPASGFSGPRSSPAVAQGKVVTLGVRGMLSVLDAASGRKLWRKDDFRAYPNFHPSSSPLVVDGLVIAQLGGRENGAVVAYDLATGDEKWKRPGATPSYASPALLTVAGTRLVIAQTDNRVVAVHAATGALAWESEAPAAGGGPGGPGGGGGRGGGGRDYRAATPVVTGDTVIIAGRGVKALQFKKDGDRFTATERWNNADKSVQFNTPTLKDGALFALSPNNELYCLDASDGKALWTAPLPGANPPAGGPAGGPPGPRADFDSFRLAPTWPAPSPPPHPDGAGERAPATMGGPSAPAAWATAIKAPRSWPRWIPTAPNAPMAHPAAPVGPEVRAVAVRAAPAGGAAASGVAAGAPDTAPSSMPGACSSPSRPAGN